MTDYELNISEDPERERELAAQRADREIGDPAVPLSAEWQRTSAMVRSIFEAPLGYEDAVNHLFHSVAIGEDPQLDTRGLDSDREVLIARIWLAAQPHLGRLRGSDHDRGGLVPYGPLTEEREKYDLADQMRTKFARRAAMDARVAGPLPEPLTHESLAAMVALGEMWDRRNPDDPVSGKRSRAMKRLFQTYADAYATAIDMPDSRPGIDEMLE